MQIQEQKEPDCVKPDCPLIGTDGNIFHLMGIASGTLRKNGMQEQTEEMRNRIFQCQSYDSALSIIGDYVIGKACLLFSQVSFKLSGSLNPGHEILRFHSLVHSFRYMRVRTHGKSPASAGLFPDSIPSMHGIHS